MTSEEMTSEEAIEIIVRLPLLKISTRDPIDKVSEALSMAVEALEQERPRGECRDRLKEIFREASKIGGDIFNLSTIEQIIDGEPWL